MVSQRFILFTLHIVTQIDDEDDDVVMMKAKRWR